MCVNGSYPYPSLQLMRVPSNNCNRITARQQAEDIKISVGSVDKILHDHLHIPITQDETWVDHYDPVTKAQSKQWKHFNSPLPKKKRVTSSAGRVMLTVFWDQHGVVMMGFLAKDSTIPRAYYASLLQKRKAFKTKRCEILTKGVCILQDNGPLFATLMEVWSCAYDILPHPPYSPDLAS
ncbi:histone-lysine N-methyltransferase SETMAR-like [Penaeus monodon]|uniref:histone-lysine N-methyltransferase SETMAR-like n=1 Tax=Penaeus monodon TaxID=6687 RepID=UPI0018A7C797|nr:histone-lysine N-methyltransferase SETMAR-like [Penaeus monodon]